MPKEEYIISDGTRLHRDATIAEIARAVPIRKWHRLSTMDIGELDNGVYIRSWGDGRFTLDGHDDIPYARIWRELPECEIIETIGYLRSDSLETDPYTVKKAPKRTFEGFMEALTKSGYEFTLSMNAMEMLHDMYKDEVISVSEIVSTWHEYNSLEELVNKYGHLLDDDDDRTSRAMIAMALSRADIEFYTTQINTILVNESAEYIAECTGGKQ